MKRMFTSILAVVLLLGMLLSLTACSKKNEKSKKSDKNDEAETTAAASTGAQNNGEQNNGDKNNTNGNTNNVNGNQNNGNQNNANQSNGDQTNAPVQIPEGALVFDKNTQFTPGNPQKALDPKAVYDSLTYTPQMFYGDYRLLGGDEGEKAYAETTSYVDFHYYNAKQEDTVKKMTAVPFRLEAGPHTFAHIINQVAGKNFLRASFYTEQGNMDYEICAYTVNGNTLTLTPLALYEFNRENNHLRFVLSETVLTYQFRFEGRKLTLTNGKDTVTIQSGLDITTDDPYVHVKNYCSVNSPKLNNIDRIHLSWYLDESKQIDGHSIYTEEETFGNEQQPYAVMEENGLFTLTMSENGQTVTRQFVYFYCWNDGIILSDGHDTYYYNDNYSDRYINQLDGNLTYQDMEKLENVDKEKLEQIVKTKEELLTDLVQAFQDAGISATINPDTGEVAMDAAVLFPVGQYAVSTEGKALLQRFIAVYTGVVFDEKYDGFISKIMVEGHTDSTGNYSDNQVLSQNRADSVKALCLEYGKDCAAQMSQMLQAVGYSSDYLIYDAAGNEDQAASRRVCFRFMINLNG